MLVCHIGTYAYTIVVFCLPTNNNVIRFFAVTRWFQPAFYSIYILHSILCMVT